MERNKEVTRIMKPLEQAVKIQTMVLEDEILDYKVASARVYKTHWLSTYFQHRVDEKIKQWEKLTGRRYEHKDD
jgi:hypothetical protein